MVFEEEIIHIVMFCGKTGKCRTNIGYNFLKIKRID